jgi:hypothetical protein
MDTEKLRRRYLPSRVHVLFVGESPPAGGTFFYRGNSHLFRNTKEAFEAALQRRWDNATDFLRFFQSSGFFLEDLCKQPMNRLGGSERHERCQASVSSLAERIRRHAPEHLVVTPKRIERYVVQAAGQAGHSMLPFVIPFPAMGWQVVYRDALSSWLKRFSWNA